MASWTLYVIQPATITVGLQEPHRQQLFLEQAGCEPQASKSIQVVLGPLLGAAMGLVLPAWSLLNTEALGTKS